MWTIRIRWRALLRPWCWLTRHDVRAFTVIHPVWTPGGWYCPRCGERRPDGRRVVEDDGAGNERHVWETLSWDGGVLCREVTATCWPDRYVGRVNLDGSAAPHPVRVAWRSSKLVGR